MSGSVNGGSGTDMLNYVQYTTGVAVNLNSGTATGTGSVSNIDDVKGGSSNDVILGNAADNHLIGSSGNDYMKGMGGDDILEGNTGNDYLFGSEGRDLLIGGTGGDHLAGGSDDDIMLAGTLRSGVNRDMIMNEWTRTDLTASERVQHLRFGGGFNGTHRLNWATVNNNDSANDRLFGQSGSDWFWGHTSERRDWTPSDFINK